MKEGKVDEKVLILEDQEETRNALVAIVKRVDANAVVLNCLRQMRHMLLL